MIMRVKECYNKSKKNQSWGMLCGDQSMVTRLQRLKRPIK
jgi:hypothetical protein